LPFETAETAADDPPAWSLATLRAFFCEPVGRLRFLALGASYSAYPAYSAYSTASVGSTDAVYEVETGSSSSSWVRAGSFDVEASDGGGPYQL